MDVEFRKSFIILCSPSPGSEAVLTVHPFLLEQRVSNASPSFSMKAVPGVIQFVSQEGPALRIPKAVSSLANQIDLNRRNLCCRIFAIGTTPSIPRKTL